MDIFMKRQLLHTPEGVRDIYNEECERKFILQNELHQTLKEYGYHPIQTPTFEFFDIFNREIGTTPSKDLYKFFDREGNTLVLRPDITPSIARCAAKYFSEEDMPIRLCYMGNTFINNTSYQGRLKENTQLGAELIGDSTVDADAEILAMAADCLHRAGLREFQLSVGHAEFFRGLSEAAGLDEEQEEELRELISNKNYFGVSEFAETLNLKEDLNNLFQMLGNIYIGSDELQKAKEYAAAYPRIQNAISRLEELHQVLKLYEIEKYVSFELGIVSNYQYYTGIIFAGYTFGSGEPVIKGGRYDELLTYFGKNSASIGFAVVIDQLMAALSRQKIEIPLVNQTLLLVYEPAQRQNAITQARRFREQGHYTELIVRDVRKGKAEYQAYAKRNHIAEIRFLND